MHARTPHSTPPGTPDSKAAVEEADVLDAFRKKYTSAKKVVFKPAIDPNFLDADGTHVPKNKDPTKSAIGSPNANERRVCVQVEFAGPQPIKGPAEVLCGLLGGASVAATPVFLARGRRKKKPKMCFVSDEEPAVVAGEWDVSVEQWPRVLWKALWGHACFGAEDPWGLLRRQCGAGDVVGM